MEEVDLSHAVHAWNIISHVAIANTLKAIASDKSQPSFLREDSIQAMYDVLNQYTLK